MPTGHCGGIMGRDGLMNFRKRKSTTIIKHRHHHLCPVGTTLAPANSCESDSGLWMIRQGWKCARGKGWTSLSLFLSALPCSSSRQKEGGRERERTRVPSPENVPRMPWLVGNRVTCHRSRRINKLARSDEFGSIRKTLVFVYRERNDLFDERV